MASAAPIAWDHAELDPVSYFTDCVVGAQWVTTRPLFETAMGSDDEHRVLQNILGGIMARVSMSFG